MKKIVILAIIASFLSCAQDMNRDIKDNDNKENSDTNAQENVQLDAIIAELQKDEDARIQKNYRYKNPKREQWLKRKKQKKLNTQKSCNR